jgi:hypothetical protein
MKDNNVFDAEILHQQENELQYQQYEQEAVNALKWYNTTKETRQSLAETIITQVMEGQVNPIDVHLSLKCLEDIIKRITDHPGYKDALLTEAQKHGKSFEMHNATLQVKEVGTKWDYSQTGDSTLKTMQDMADALSTQIKDRQKFLQTIPEGGIADPSTGEMVFRAAKQSTTSVSVTLK